MAVNRLNVVQKSVLILVLLVFILVMMFLNTSKKDATISMTKEERKILKVSFEQSVISHSHSLLHDDHCSVTCTTGIPCEYPDGLDFRIIVITFNRPSSLNKTLQSILNLDTMGDKVGVHIWIDRDRQTNVVDKDTVRVSDDFVKNWKHSDHVCVHIQNRNAYIIGQWIDTWRPKVDTNELTLILEDDVDISPHAYHWLKATKNKYGHLRNVAGYTLQMENVNTVKKVNSMNTHPHSGPKGDSVFAYSLIGTWGYAPHPYHWRGFQDWFHKMRLDTNFHPYVPNLITTNWYKIFEKKNKQDSMWEQWFIYYCYNNSLFTIYSNLLPYSGKQDVLLSSNRRVAGLHYSKGSEVDNKHLLLTEWKPKYGIYPDKIAVYDFDGLTTNKTLN